MSDTQIEGAGELLRAGYEIAAQIPLGEIVTLTDPRDLTKVDAVLVNGELKPISTAVFDHYRDRPVARIGTATLTRLDSFIELTNRFKAPNSAVFAKDDPTAPKLTTVFDYHPEGEMLANFQRHRATYAFPVSDEWRAWSKANAEPMKMMDFAAFLEDRIVDVVTDAAPASAAAKDFMAKTGGNIAGPSDLMRIARTLQVNETSTLREARNLSSGEAEVVFQSEHLDAAGNKLVLPNLFMICIPVFARAPEFYQILARFRYRKTGGAVVFWYELWRPDLVFEQAFTEACNAVREQTELPLFVGSPEV
jgi:uncharacterized protein YfdQ (DUF2303 family)